MKTTSLYFSILFVFVMFTSCENEEASIENLPNEQVLDDSTPESRISLGNKAPWTNILIDNFNAGSNIDARWQRTGSWSNDGPQRYDYNSDFCRYKPWNAEIASRDGRSCLRLQAYKVAGENVWESGHVKSWTSFEPGRNQQIHVQVSAKLEARDNRVRGFDETYGVWPAIWTVQEDAWPTQGEIDMMEAYSYGYSGGERYASNLFYGRNVGQNQLGTSATRHYDDIGEGWHTYDMYWTNVNGNVYVDILVDGDLKANYHNGINGNLRLQNFGPHNVILNVNIGSNDGIFNNNNINIFWNAYMFVDFVRVRRTNI